MSSLRAFLRRFVPLSSSTPSHRLCSAQSCPPPSSPVFVHSVRCYASPILPRASSSQAPRSSGSAVASMGLPTGFPALSIKQKADKTPMEYIAEVPPKEVDGGTAVCEGGRLTAITSHTHRPLVRAPACCCSRRAHAMPNVCRRRRDGPSCGVHPAQQGEPEGAVHLPLLRTAIRAAHKATLIQPNISGTLHSRERYVENTRRHALRICVGVMTRYLLTAYKHLMNRTSDVTHRLSMRS